MSVALAEKYPILPGRIRSMARQGLCRAEILRTLREDGFILSRNGMNRLIRQAGIVVSPPKNPTRIEYAKTELAAEIEATKAQIAATLASQPAHPFKIGTILQKRS